MLAAIAPPQMVEPRVLTSPALRVRLAPPPASGARSDLLESGAVREIAHASVVEPLHPSRAPGQDRPAPTGVERPASPPSAQSELHFYAVSEIDVFPQLVDPVALADAAAGRPGATQRLRMELLIDADGTVRQVYGLDTETPVLAAARERLREARFFPARRSGRAVASRIEIEVEYGTGAASR